MVGTMRKTPVFLFNDEVGEEGIALLNVYPVSYVT
jgi:hypothetical protein